jgi:HAD superfamily hydrolase (TIGR01509 family)
MARQSRSRQDIQRFWPNVSAVIFDVEGTLVDAVPLTLRSRKTREQIIETQGNSFKRSYLKRTRPLRGASSLLRAIKHEGRQIGIATDCSRSELAPYLRSAGVTRLVDRAACGDDARRGKPHADLIKLAVTRLRAEPSASLLIGDTPSDAEAARKAGVAAVGLLTGGFRLCDLKAAGCRAVFEDLATLGRALKSG